MIEDELLCVRIAYELYKLDWCRRRGFNPEDVARAKANNEEYEGQMYSCIEEFYDCEYQDDSYIEYLMNDFEI